VYVVVGNVADVSLVGSLTSTRDTSTELEVYSLMLAKGLAEGDTVVLWEGEMVEVPQVDTDIETVEEAVEVPVLEEEDLGVAVVHTVLVTLPVAEVVEEAVLVAVLQPLAVLEGEVEAVLVGELLVLAVVVELAVTVALEHTEAVLEEVGEAEAEAVAVAVALEVVVAERTLVALVEAVEVEEPVAEEVEEAVAEEVSRSWGMDSTLMEMARPVIGGLKLAATAVRKLS